MPDKKNPVSRRSVKRKKRRPKKVKGKVSK